MEHLNNVRPIVRGVKTATTPNQLGIGPWFYHNGSHLGTTLDLIKEPFDNLSGYTIFPRTSGFRNHSGMQDWKSLMAFEYSPTIYTDRNEHTWAVVRTSSRVDAYGIGDLLQYGMVDNPDNAANRFAGWLRATEGSHAIEYVKPNPEIGLFEFPEHKIDYSKYGMTDMRLYVKDFAGLVPINKFGFYISKIENTEQTLRNLIYKNYVTEGVGFNPVTEALIEKLLEKEGFGPAREIAAYGVENFEKEGIAAATHQNGKAILAASKNINEWASRVAEAYGLSGPEGIEFVKEFIWHHELFHVLDRRKGVSKDKTEAELGELLAEFYEEVAQTGKPDHAKYYRALRDFNRRYAAEYREGRQSQESLLSISNLEALVDKYASEAERLGLEGEAAEKYVSSKLEKEAKAIKSAKDGKGNSKEAQDEEGSTYEKSELNSGEAKEQESAESDGDGAEASGESSGSSE